MKKTDLFCQEWNPGGRGPLVLIHAFPLTSEMWEGQIDYFKKTFRVIAYDIRGFGKSPLGEGQFTMEWFVDDLIGVMDQFRTDRVILCGLSLGGYIALRAAEKIPDRIKGLVLCDTRSEADDNAGKLKRAQAIQTLKTQGVEVFARAFVPNLLSEPTRKNHPQVEEDLMKIVLAQSAEGICAAQLAMLSRTDTTAALAGFSFPTLVVHGELDPLIPLAHAREMQRRIPHARLAAITSAGHMSNLENPEEFNLELGKFLKGIA